MKSIALTILCLAFLLFLGTGCRPVDYGGSGHVTTPDLRDDVVEVPLNLGLEKPGVSLDAVELEKGIAPSPTGVRVTTPQRVFVLNSLAEMRGLVDIHNSQQALRFVRLRTSRACCYAWQGAAVQEIVSTAQITQSAFAGTGHLGSSRSQASEYLLHDRSGLYGVLSPAAYRQGKYQPPIIQTIPGGFRITRWVCIFSSLDGTSVQKWQETVGPDGSYHKVVLKSQSPPHLKGTQMVYHGASVKTDGGVM